MAEVPVVLLQALMNSIGLDQDDIVQKIEITQTGVIATVFLKDGLGEVQQVHTKFGPCAATYTVVTQINYGEIGTTDEDEHTHEDGTVHSHGGPDENQETEQFEQDLEVVTTSTDLDELLDDSSRAGS